MSQAGEPIVVEQSYPASAEEVWTAITVQPEMIKWYFGTIPDFKPEVGFECRFSVDAGERSFVHLWKVTEVVPERLLKYDWYFPEYEGYSFVVFEIFLEGDSTRLRLTHTGIESYPQEIPELTRESGLAGWTYFLKDSLKKYFESR